MKTLFLILGMIVAMCLHSSIGFSQPMPGYCLKRSLHAKLEVTQKKSGPFFKIRSGVFCTTPVNASNGNLLTGCDDGFIRIVSNMGVLINSIKIEHDADSGMSSNPEIIALRTKPETFVVTSETDRLVMKFDANGKIISQKKLVVDPGKPYGFNRGDYFFIDANGVGHFISENNSETLVSISSGFLNEPSTRVNPNGENEAVVGDDQGNLLVVRTSGEKKSIKISGQSLGNSKIAPDGRVWISDAAGVMYVVNTDTFEVKSFTLPLNKKMNRPVFLKNGKVAFGTGENIFIYDADHLEKPAAIYDSKINRDDYHSGIMSSYLGKPMESVDLELVELTDGTENLWVPTHGGYHFINDQGAVTGSFSFASGAGDAESFSPPFKVKDGSYVIGSYFGVDRINIRSSTKLISTGSWLSCSNN